MKRVLSAICLLIIFNTLQAANFLQKKQLVIRDRKASFENYISSGQDGLEGFYAVLPPDTAMLYYGNLGRNGAVILISKSYLSKHPTEDVYARDMAQAFQKYFLRDAIISGLIGLIWTACVISIIVILFQKRRVGNSDTVMPETIPSSKGARAYGALFDVVHEGLIFGIRMFIIIFIYIFCGLISSIRGILDSYLTFTFHFAIVYYFLYYFYSEAIWGATLGKLRTGLHVVDLAGGNASALAILIRTICRFIPFDCISFVFYRSEWKDGHFVFWHDKLSRTRVVNWEYHSKLKTYIDRIMVCKIGYK